MRTARGRAEAPLPASPFAIIPRGRLQVTNEEFEVLVHRLEGEARRSPAAYAFRVWLLAMLGNAYLALIVLLLLALFLASIASVAVLKGLAVKLVAVIGVFLWIVLRALWVSIPPPEGMELRRKEAPELFATIDALRRKLRAPRFHHVLIDDRFNAAVVQSPRLGIFGWYRNYLLIGLPLMKSLSVEQFKAVLAHELGHLSRGHGRIANWIYRQRLRWSRLMAVLEEKKSNGGFLFRPFLKWYAPYFNAYSFPLARANEYEADAASARLTSPAAAAEALTGVSVVGRYLDERFWPQLYKQAEDSPRPGFAPYASMAMGATGDVDASSAQAWLEQALARQTTLDDTHPSLGDRLSAIGESVRLAPPARGEAADRLLGGARDRVTEDFDRRWHENILPAWEARHREVQEGRTRLAALDEQAAAGDLSLTDAYDRARLTESLGAGTDAALEQFRALHARAAEDPIACYALGARLLARDDEAGAPLVDHAMLLDERLIVPGCEALRDYCWRAGREQEAHDWHARMTERAALASAAEEERAAVHVSDKLEPHGLPAETIADLCVQLRTTPGVRKAYFVRKRVKHFPDRPCYVLGFTVESAWRPSTKRRRAAEVQQQLTQGVNYPGETLILNVEGENYRFGRKLRWMRGSRIL
jgi:Zn-dependent protease with chaperone function